MITTIRNWLVGKWRLIYDADNVVKAYEATFQTAAGQVVLQHLVDEIYCKVYEGTDPVACVAFNARRAVVHEILTNIDMVQNPSKYNVRMLMEHQYYGENNGA